MKFVSYNIQYGIGLDGKYDLDRIAASLAGADVIALQEVTRGFSRNAYVDLATDIAALFPEHFSVFGAPCDLHLDSRIEDGRLVERRFQFGNMVLSRWPILSTRTLLLPRSRTIDTLNLQRGAVEAVITTPLGPLRVYSIHLDHMSPAERLAQVRHLKERVQAFTFEAGSISGGGTFGFGDTPLPEDYILLGDFNMQPGTPEYVEMTGPADPYYGRSLRFGDPVDPLDHLGKLVPGCYSWMEPDDHERRMHLDYGFISSGLLPHLTDAFVDTAAEGSDHFPLWVELN